MFPLDDAPIKVWSVIVTLFGDLAANLGDEISGACLSELMESLGIRSDATRVALHRLRKDGWLEGRKEGRQAFYRLTEFGLSETAKASPRIYGVAPAGTPTILFALPNGKDAGSAIQIASGLFVSSNPPKNAWILTPRDDQLPRWVQESIVPYVLLDAFTDLESQIGKLPKTSISPRQTAVERITIIHPWRRLALRVPAIAENLLGNSKIADCRNAVINALDERPRQTLKALHEKA